MGISEGRTALDTGASRGIGKATAQRLASVGASVFVTASQLGPKPNYEGSLDETVAMIEETGGRAAAVACVLGDAEGRTEWVVRGGGASGAPWGSVG